MTAFLLVLAIAFSTPNVSTPGSSPAEPAKARALILTGVNDHDWEATTPYLKKTLEASGYFSVDVSEDPDAPVLSDRKSLVGYQVLILNLNRDPRWTPEREENLLDYVRQGGGLVVLHAADNAFPGWPEYERLVGGAWRSNGTAFPGRSTFHPAYGPFRVTVVDLNHPITQGLGSTFTTTDEMYTNLKLQKNIHVLAAGDYKGKTQPLLFLSGYGKGRMYHSALGHDLKAMHNRQFIDTLIRGTRWAAGRLN
ncbi:ThuA domain-containing protein [Singulisphaera rosea]